MISLQDASIRLLEDGISVPRARICTVAVDTIREIGACYPTIGDTTMTVELPSPGVMERPAGLVSITSVKAAPTVDLMMAIASSDSEVVLRANGSHIVIPPAYYSVKDGTIIAHKLLWGMEVEIAYRTLPIADDGWPMVHEAVIEPVVLKLYNLMIRSTMVRAALRSSPTNNMIIATKADVNREYHRLVSHARATISSENEGINLNSNDHE